MTAAGSSDDVPVERSWLARVSAARSRVTSCVAFSADAITAIERLLSAAAAAWPAWRRTQPAMAETPPLDVRVTVTHAISHAAEDVRAGRATGDVEAALYQVVSVLTGKRAAALPATR